MTSPSKEGRLIIALQALEKDKDLSLRAAAKIYNVTFKTLARQRAGIPVKRKGSSLGLNPWDLVSLCEDARHSQESNR